MNYFSGNIYAWQLKDFNMPPFGWDWALLWRNWPGNSSLIWLKGKDSRPFSRIAIWIKFYWPQFFAKCYRVFKLKRRGYSRVMADDHVIFIHFIMKYLYPLWRSVLNHFWIISKPDNKRILWNPDGFLMDFSLQPPSLPLHNTNFPQMWPLTD